MFKVKRSKVKVTRSRDVSADKTAITCQCMVMSTLNLARIIDVGVVDKARLLTAASPHSGDWLHAPPITAVGLRLSDEAVRVAVVHRLGSKACEPHTCVCGKAVDARGLHGLSCRRSAPRQQRHSWGSTRVVYFLGQ